LTVSGADLDAVAVELDVAIKAAATEANRGSILEVTAGPLRAGATQPPSSVNQ
jgi:hypothetical protein